MKKLLLPIILAIVIGLMALADEALASEGFVKLENAQSQTRCFVQSAMTGENKYDLVISCRDLIYPPSEDAINYALWANPLGGGNPAYIGNLGLGRRTAQVGFPFESLFVTSELSEKPKAPSIRKVLFGEVRSIEFMGDFEKKIEELETKFEKQQGMEAELVEPTTLPENVTTQEQEEKTSLKDILTKYAFLPIAVFLGVIIFILFLIRHK